MRAHDRISKSDASCAGEEKRDKYWGYITTVFATDDFTLKEVFMKAGTQSSMEYHVRKDEYYYIQSGKLKVSFYFW